MSRLSLLSYLLIFPFYALLLAPNASATNQDRGHRAPRQVRQQIDTLEEEWKTATIDGDATLMDRLLSEDYVGISWNGQVNTKAQQLDRVRNRATLISRMDLTDVKVKLLGNVAIVTARADVTGTNDGSSINGVFRYTRVYQRISGGAWKITNFESTRARLHDHNTQLSLNPSASP